MSLVPRAKITSMSGQRWAAAERGGPGHGEGGRGHGGRRRAAANRADIRSNVTPAIFTYWLSRGQPSAREEVRRRAVRPGAPAALLAAVALSGQRQAEQHHRAADGLDRA